MKTIEGLYQDGKIQLSEIPNSVSEKTQVLITFLEPGDLNMTQVRELIEKLETIAGIQTGLDQLNADKTRSIEDFSAEMKQKYDIPG